MKKLLGVSIAAMLAVTPMIASADPASGNHLSDAAPTATTGNAPFKAVTVDTAANIATTSYVQGAYNDAIAAINKVATTAGAAQTVDQVKTAIGNAAGDGLTGDTTNGTLELDVAANKAIQLVGETAGSKELDLVLADGTLTQNSSGLKVGTITNSNISDGTISQAKIDGLGTALNGKQAQLKTNGTGTPNIQTTVYTTMNTNISGTGENQARDDVLVTEKAVATALAAVNTLADNAQTAQEVEDKIDAAAGAGLATDGLGVLSVTAGDGIQVADDKVAAKLTDKGGLAINSSTKDIEVVVDGTTIVKDSSTGALGVKANTFDAYNAASNAQTAIETKLTTGGGATGYAINAQSLQVQGSNVSTETGVTATISNSTVPVFTAWGADTTTNVYVKSAAYTTTARANGVAAN
jgi:hypothetical protein